MVNILFLHSGAELYGADQILINIVTNIDRNKFCPYVVLPNDGPLRKVLEDKRVKVDVIEYPVVRRKYFNPLGMFNYCVEFLKSTNQLKRYIEKNDIHIIHNNTLAVFEGVYLSIAEKIPVIFHLHEMIEHPRILARIMYKIAIKGSSVVLGVSTALKEYVESLTGGESKIIVLHNGILDNATKIETAISLREEFGIPENAVVFSHIGRINAIKGQKDFVDALKKALEENDNIYGLLIGDAFSGQEWRIKELLEYIDEQKVSEHVKYVGYRNDMSNIYKTTDVLVLSSIQYDSFPTVVLEAMSYSKPVIAYRCGGVVEMVEDGKTGYLVEQRNISALAYRIGEIGKKEEDRFNMGTAGREKFVKEFSISTFINAIEDIYFELLK